MRDHYIGAVGLINYEPETIRNFEKIVISFNSMHHSNEDGLNAFNECLYFRRIWFECACKLCIRCYIIIIIKN